MIKLLNQLTHVRLAAPDVEASVRFYEEQIGMRVTDRTDDAVYLRNWGDYYRYSLVITHGDEPALEVMAWRAQSAEALEEAAHRVEATGIAGSWRESSLGHGRSYTFTGPFGHTMELFWEVERFHGEGEDASSYPDRPSRRSRDGVAPRSLDHVTIAASDVRAFAAWYSETLGFRIMAHTTLEHGGISVFTVLTTNEKSHDLGVVLDGSSRAGRANHFAYWVDAREDLLRAADILMENGTPMEYGPSIHGIGEQNFLYFRDPSTFRVEVNTGGYRNYVPDWEAYEWHRAQGSNNFYRNGQMPMSMTESFPPADGPSATEEGILPGTENELINPFAKHGQG
ncbi:MAG TPA: VOC family protein [Microbacteriaceae bacterium]